MVIAANVQFTAQEEIDSYHTMQESYTGLGISTCTGLQGVGE